MATLNEQEIRQAREWGLLKSLSAAYCFTGKHSETRSKMEKMVQLLGGVVHATVGSGTSYLVIPNDSNPQSSKARAARERGVTIISEAELCTMILPTVDELLDGVF